MTINDVRKLMGASTPHFALQLRDRIAKLIQPLPSDDPARVVGDQEIERLNRLATHGETRGEPAQADQRSLPSLESDDS